MENLFLIDRNEIRNITIHIIKIIKRILDLIPIVYNKYVDKLKYKKRTKMIEGEYL